MLPTSPTAMFPYRILAKVGEGAMGQVFRAEDIELGRQVAIKVVKPSFLEGLSENAAQAALQRFLQEARAAAALSHAGVTVVYRVGSEGGWPYIAMEWLDGQTLEDVLIERQTLPLDQVARLGLQVLAALDAAHGVGIVHRDIKPANLIVTTQGRIKVTDFGIARVQGSDLAQTQVGLILGTPHYAAPEQLAGRSVDARADLYALGVVLYEAVTGRLPFDASTTYELMGLVQTAVPPVASSLVADGSRSFDLFLDRALAKTPERRFSTAAEMAAALQPFLTRNSQSHTEGTPRATTRAEPTLAAVPTACVDGANAAGLVAGVVRQWPATALGRQEFARLLERVLEKPLHAGAFCGALEVSGALLLVCDGALFAAFDPATGRVGDLVIEALPREIDATLFACPEGTQPRVMTLLASLLVPAEPRLSGLDASFVDVPQLATKLESEGFDGAIRFARGAQLGFALFSRGRRVLDVFGRGWPTDPSKTRWETWLSTAGATVSVEDRRASFPSIAFRRQLRELQLDVVRGRPSADDLLRSDTRAEADALELRPHAAERGLRLESTVQALIDADPAVGVTRWLLVDLAFQFEQFRRTSRWRALLEPLAAIETVKLHHSILLDDGLPSPFDAATFTSDGRLVHVVERVAVGTREAVASFLARVVAVKEHSATGHELAGAVLVAGSFDDDALDTYLEGLRASRKRSLRSALDLLSHREGFLTVGRGGCHILLIEDVDGRRRPLVPE